MDKDDPATQILNWTAFAFIVIVIVSYIATGGQ